MWQVEGKQDNLPTINHIPIDNIDIAYGYDGRYVNKRKLKALFIDTLY